MRKFAGPLALAFVALLAVFAWWQYSARVEAERTLGLDASRIVAASFSRAAEVKVGTLRGSVLAAGTDEGFLGLVPSEQTTRVPFTVDYHIDLRRIGARAYRWDSGSNTLTIDIPDVSVGNPNVDEAAGTTSQKGLYISRRASLELARQTSRRAAARSTEAARRREYLDQARANARVVVANLAQRPLAAAGLGDVRVAVSFPWEPKPGSAISSERWDESRRVEDVLNDRRNQTR